MAAGDIYRLSMLGDYGPAIVTVVTAHVKFLSGTATVDGACAYFVTNLLNLLKTKQANVFYWRQINALSVNLTPPVSSQYTTGLPLQGTQASDALPSPNALVVTLRTQYAGRSYRGRQYIPGLAEGLSTGSIEDGATVSAIQTYYDDLVAGIGAGGSSTDYQWGVYSRKVPVFTPITSTLVRSTLGTQRRRRPGVGV